jgi:hypothetical protein
MNTSQKLSSAFRISTMVILLALVLEFILGMYTNLYVKFPETLVNGNAWEWAMSQSAVVTTHVILGTLLALLSIVVAGFAIALKNKAAIIVSLLGFAAIWFAYLSGSVFLSNIEADTYSFTMSLGFIAAMVVYGMANVFVRPGNK